MANITQKIVDIDGEEEGFFPGRREIELLHAYGGQALAFFGLSPENEHFLAPGGAGLVNYRLVSKVAVVLGDPICAPEAIEQVMESFLAFCSLQGWRVALYQVRPDFLESYRALKLHAFKMGEEALLSPQTFTLNGSALANVRTSCRRAEREEIDIHWYEGVPPVEVIYQLRQVSSAWLQNKDTEQSAETGFSTGRLDDLVMNAQLADRLAASSTVSIAERFSGPRLVTGVATTSSGMACAFVTFTPIYATATGDLPAEQGWGWALDLMRRLPEAPPGVMDLLLVRAIERFRTAGASVMSLGLAAWADKKQEITSGQQQLASFVTARLGLFESHRTLFSFKQKFHPCWESRYLVTNTSLALPKIAFAVLQLRNYSRGRWAKWLGNLFK